MDQNNFQIEDLEEQACKRSNMAKRVVAGVGLAAVGAGAAFAADQLTGDEAAETPALTADELTDTVTNGVTENDMPSTPEADTTTPSQPEEVHVYHHTVQPQPEPEPEVEFEKSTTFVDENGNVIANVDEGTYDGKDFAVFDLDGDNRADYIAYDANGDHVYQDNEIVDVSGQNLGMGNSTNQMFVQVETNNDPGIIIEPDPEPWAILDDSDDDLKDITNDYDKTGETYNGDLAENNPDYNSDGDIRLYADVERNDGNDFAMTDDEEIVIEDNFDQDDYMASAEDFDKNDDMVSDVYDEPFDAGDDMAYDDSMSADDMSNYDLV